MSISVLGAGAFGTGLAIALARADAQVTLWGRDPDHCAKMSTARQNARRLDGIAFPESLTVTADLDRAARGQIVLLAVPAQSLSAFLSARRWRADQTLVACCKGIDMASGLGPGGLIVRHAPDSTPAVLTGPSFARDLARAKPTALTLATPDAAQGQALQSALTTPTLRLYRSTDMRGAELGGALKNVIAIAAGVAIGADLGESARAAVVTRGFAELVSYAMALGAEAETLNGLSGFGDLILTCTSTQSRNFRFGRALGAGEPFTQGITVEGAATARAATAHAQTLGLDLPVTQTVARMLNDELSATEAARVLLSRPLRAE